jgi:hypothetical protein
MLYLDDFGFEWLTYLFVINEDKAREYVLNAVAATNSSSVNVCLLRTRRATPTTNDKKLLAAYFVK